MRILLIGTGSNLKIPPDGWGGIEKVIWNHYEQLEKRGHQVDIFNKKDFRELVSLIRDNYYDVIHSHFHKVNEVLESAGVPYAYTCHAGSWERQWGSYEKAFNAPLCYPLPFEMMGNRLEKEHHSIWNGADPAIFKSLDKFKGRCVAVGKYEPRKNFERVVSIVDANPELELYLVGQGNERFSGHSRVIVLPNSPEDVVARLMGTSEFFFHMADEEADCLVVKEAALSGCELKLSYYNFRVMGGESTVPSDLSRIHELNCNSFRENILRRFTWDKVVDNLLDGYGKFLTWRKV